MVQSKKSENEITIGRDITKSPETVRGRKQGKLYICIRAEMKRRAAGYFYAISIWYIKKPPGKRFKRGNMKGI